MNRGRNETGLSLLEIMIAIVISGVALMGTMGAIELSARYVEQGQVSSRALALAQARLEGKRSVLAMASNVSSWSWSRLNGQCR